MKKIIAILLAGMMTASALAGCGGSSSSTNKTSSGSGDSKASSASDVSADGKVDESYFGDENNISLKVWAPDAAVATTKNQIKAFKELYSDKTMDITVVAQGEDDAATQILNDASAAADVFGFASDQLNKLTDADVIAKCAFSDAVTSYNSEESIKAATLKDKDGKDTVYAYPETTNGYYLVYNKKVVSDDQAKKFEDVLAACKKAGKTFVMDAGNGYYSCIFAFTGGVKVDGFEEDGLTQKFTDYDEDEAVSTLQAFGKLIKEYKGTFTSLSVENISSGFKSGSCGAGIDGSWNSTNNKEALGDNLGATKLPTINVGGKDKQMVSMFGYKYLGVNGSSKFPRTSQILAYYLASETCQRERAKDLGWGPTNTKVAGEDVVTGSNMLTAIGDQSKYAVAQVNIVSTFWDPMANLGNKLIAADFKPDNTDAIKKLLNSTIDNIKDE